MRHTLITALFIFMAGPALADECPPSAAHFDTWTWIPSWDSGDDWLTQWTCSSDAHRNAVKDLVITHLGLDENWSYWDDGMLSSANICNPNTWGARVINGGYAAQLTGDMRDNDSFNHFASPGGILPDGTPINWWLSQFVSYYVSEEGYKWECLEDDDAAGPGDGFTYASNPFSNSACTLYYPWFWNKTAFDRASTLIHEAAHEFSRHLDDSVCDNRGSCDTAWMDNNAQSFQIIFDAQAVDAYQREPNSRELKVINFGNDVCGYLPLLPDQDRFALVQVMIDKLMMVFQTLPPVTQYPASAIIDNVPGTIWDLADDPNGQAGLAYRIDIVNQARWGCDRVCEPSEYRFPDGPKACNEEYWPENAGINAANRQRCDELNAQIAQGVSLQEHTSLRRQAWYMQTCKPGVSPEHLEEICRDLIPGTDHVDDIDIQWPLPNNLGYGYSASKAIRDCQIRFCGEQDLATWDQAASEVCYEWDDQVGCMPLLCDDLEGLEAEHGRDSLEYLRGVVCRASELEREIPGVREEDVGCSRGFNDCIITGRYMPLWQEQLAGDDCWSDSLPAGVQIDPYYTQHRRAVTEWSAERFQVLDRSSRLMEDECLMQEAQCEALQAAMQAALAKILNLKQRERPHWQRPPGPDPWEHLQSWYDRELELTMIDIGEELLGPAPEEQLLFQDARLRKAAARPEARVALAELIGHDTFFRMGGAQNVREIFSPTKLRRFSGPDAELDPYGLSLEGVEAEVDALARVYARSQDRGFRALLSRAGELDSITYHHHVNAMLRARTGEALLAAHEALEADLARR